MYNFCTAVADAGSRKISGLPMSTIQQPCPSCGRRLELPAGATGRLAKCPACEATFTVAAAEPAEQSRQADPQPGVIDAYDTPQADAAAAPVPQGVNPFSQPLDSGAVSRPEGEPVTWRPYEPVYSSLDPVAAVDELEIVPRRIEEVLSSTGSIFLARWSPLMLALIAVLAATVAAVAVPAFILSTLANAGARPFVVIGTLLGIPLLYLFGCYVSVGIARNAMAVARNGPAPMMELFPPLGLVVRFLIGSVLMTLGSGLLVGLFAGLVSLVGAAAGDGLARVVAVIGAVAAIALGTAAYWLLWSWMFVVSDGRTTVLGSFKAAYSLTMINKGTSVLLIILASALSAMGASLCYVGLFLTLPFTNLMLAVAYLMMTNQQIGDPRVAQAKYPPPPTQPTF